MYQALLTRRYLTTKIMPLLSVLAVTACTAMVLIVWSIMGGFLVMLLASGRSLIGDVAITWPTIGFAHYGDLIGRLERDPAVAAATPMVEGFGLLKLPDNRINGVFIKGIDGPSYARVVDYEQTLWWKPIATPLPRDTERQDIRLSDDPDSRARLARLEAAGKTLTDEDPVTGRPRPGVVLGIEAANFSKRTPEGYYRIGGTVGVRTASGTVDFSRASAFIANHSVTINVLPLGRTGRSVDLVTRTLPVVNEFRTGVFDIDEKTVLLRLDVLQEMLKMGEAERVDPAAIDPYAVSRGGGGSAGGTGAGGTGAGGGVETFGDVRARAVDPARVTTVLVRARPGFTPDDLKAAAVAIYKRFAADHAGEVPPAPGKPGTPSISIATWEENQGTIVAAVRKEIGLVMGILIFISMVAVLLILSIFWSMVNEKTRDIGVLRAVGAGKAGVAWLWVRFGLTIGIAGSILGGLAAYGIVHNINPIHEWMGRSLHLYLWDPKVYYFSVIPNQIEPWKAATVLAGGVVFSVLGALWPAVRAANMDPVKSLRFE